MQVATHYGVLPRFRLLTAIAGQVQILYDDHVAHFPGIG
jgi:hypothetical protein